LIFDIRADPAMSDFQSGRSPFDLSAASTVAERNRRLLRQCPKPRFRPPRL
jgi:hypothetical protein